MRKTTIATIVVLAVGAVALFFALGGGLDREQRLINRLSMDFMEDLQFKDFRRSASYHHKLEHDRVDVGKTLEKLFLIKPESLDIQNYRIIKSDVDSTGDRARVHIRTRFHRLNMKDEPEDGELILYWMKRNPDCPIGGKCVEGVCENGAGQALYFEHKSDKPLPEPEAKELLDEIEQHKKRNPKHIEKGPTKITCEVGAEPRWFMNLDSTLKEKRYNY